MGPARVATLYLSGRTMANRLAYSGCDYFPIQTSTRTQKPDWDPERFYTYTHYYQRSDLVRPYSKT